MKHFIPLVCLVAATACVETVQPTTIPASLTGQWGLVAGDCILGRADAKGLMTVTATTLTFYESRGTLTEVAERTASSIDGQFAMNGEGMTWTRDMRLALNGSGQLVRTEQGPDAMPGPLVYTKCP
jgi:hypothetical protein